MKRYKKWMAALLTGILVVTGSMSPALAAELPTEAEELVSAAEFSDEIVTNEAEIPDVSEIEEDEVAADIPVDDAAIPTAPDLTAEQPDEADTVSATPAFPVKSMTLSNDTFLYFVSDDPSFRRSYWDKNDDYINDSVTLILRTTLAAQELDLENANGDELELEQYKVTSDNGTTFKSIVYLDRDEDVTDKNFKIIRVGLRDIYGKTTWISAENVSATWTTRNHQLVTRANRFKNSATTEQAVNFIELEGDINIPRCRDSNGHERYAVGS